MIAPMARALNTRRGAVGFSLLVFLVGGIPLGRAGEKPLVEDEITDELLLLAEEDVVLSAARHKQDIVESPSAITVITRKQIANTHCTDLVCLLRQVPEVSVRRLRPFYASVGARALLDALGDKVLVLIDGREINLESIGVPYWQTLVLHLEDIERVEVIRGPGSALYGANAHSMVVSIFSRKVEEDGTEVFLGAGEVDRTNLHLRAGLKRDNWTFQLSGGYETAGRWYARDTREREFGRLRLRADRRGEAGETVLQAGLTLSEGVIYTELGPVDSQNGYIGFVQASHETDFLRAQFFFNAMGSDFGPDLPLVYRGVELGTVPEVYGVFSSTTDAEIQAQLEPFGGNLLLFGGNYRWSTFMADLNDPAEVHQHRVGLFIHDEQRLGDSLMLTAGVRFDWNSITPFTISPRAAGVWRMTPDQLLRLSFGRAFRKPSFFNTSLHMGGVRAQPGFEEIEDLFAENIGNENLDNESVTSLELGYRGRFMDGTLLLESGLFFQMYRDTINFKVIVETDAFGLPDLAHATLRFMNQGRDVNSAGGSLAATLRPTRALRIGLNYTGRYSYYVSSSPDQVEGEDERIRWEPAHLFNASLQYVPESGPRAGLAAHWHSAVDTNAKEGGSIFGDEITVHTPAVFMLGAYFSWRWTSGDDDWLEAGVRALNLLNDWFRDGYAVRRDDGEPVGAQRLGRRVLFFLRGSI